MNSLVRKTKQMKSIRFDNLGRSKWLFLLMMLSLLLLLLGIWEPIELENPKIYKWGNVVGFLIQAAFLGRMFLYKDYVQWNKKGISIRVNTLFGPSFKFKEVKATNLKEDTLEIILFGGGKSTIIDLKNIAQKDRLRLNNIIQAHTINNKKL